MATTLQDLTTFQLTGQRPESDPGDIGTLKLRPALFTGFEDLTRLRHDYPLVLVDDKSGAECVRSLTAVVNDLLRVIAPQGGAGERIRKQVLRLEQEMRGLVLQGTGGNLTEIWSQAAIKLLAETKKSDRARLSESLSGARDALNVDGEIVGCTGETPAKILAHVWTLTQRNRARAFRNRIDNLILKLREILEADFMKSGAARDPELLKNSVGTAFESVFDFKALSEVLDSVSHGDLLPDDRRTRIQNVLATLEGQEFVATAGAPAPAFVFDNCAQALEAFERRQTEMTALVKAMSIAELEIENRYDSQKHDDYFANFEPRLVGRQDQSLFPSYLILLPEGEFDASEHAKLIEILSSGLPFNILLQNDDVLGPPAADTDQGPAGARFARMAIGLDDAFVLQTSASNLYRLRERVLNGLQYQGPTLFSVYSGVGEHVADVPPYLLAAAASESRVFPTFSRDPDAGDDWAARFDIRDNPQLEADWPVHGFAFEDRDLQKCAEDTAFTIVDFAACDTRFAGLFARVAREDWHEGLVSVPDYLDLAPDLAREKVPYILMVDESNILEKVVVADILVEAARRNRAAWHSLQELGGVHNSHARRALATEREVWEAEKEQELAALKQETAPISDATAPQEETPATVEPANVADADAGEEIEQISPDTPYIETARCTSCNECTDINNRMFSYDENDQAYIADLNAGTYRQLVEAAENCQVSIIHPGKPWNTDEPDLDELIARAEDFI